MILRYVCTRKCFFNGGIRNEGDTLVLDQEVGDRCPHLVRMGEEHQLEAMQAYAEKKEDALPDVPKASGKAASSSAKGRKKSDNGDKTE